MQVIPPDLRKKASRLVAAKCTLAARVDSIHSSLDGRIGEQLSQEIKLKLEKLQEPPPVKNIKVGLNNLKINSLNILATSKTT